MARLLFEVRATDAVTYLAAAAGLLALALAASALPAWRASRVAPASALRTE
jgi:putative ABC transport system permease protein